MIKITKTLADIYIYIYIGNFRIDKLYLVRNKGYPLLI